jgi:hypothetical protein
VTRIIKRRPVPFAESSQTSRDAAREKEQDVEVDRQRVYLLVHALGVEGAICDEVEERLGLLHQNASARMHDLEKAGAITRTCRFRPTRSGRAAQVYVAVALFCQKDVAILLGTAE